MTDFAGAARAISLDDINRAARTMDLEPAIIRAVLTVETGGAGGFLSDGTGRPRILFEAHLFSRYTGGRWDISHPRISSPRWNRSLYRGGSAEYARLQEAVALDRAAALEAASWGMFQVLGRNATAVGWNGVEPFVLSMADSEADHLRAFIGYCAHAGLVDELRRKDWAAFARGYNGTAYRENRYDTKLEQAYRLAAGADPVVPEADDKPAVLRIGMRGDQVRTLQAALRLAGYAMNVDGVFGRVTEIALEQFQAAHGLAPDGVCGPATRAAMGI